MNGLVSLAASRSYTDESLDGMGALKGAACQIASITDIEGGHRINFLWLDNSEVEHTDHMDVMNGEKGGKGDKGDTGVGLPEGGTAGQVLVKKSSTDYDTEWGTPAGGGDMLKSVYDTDNDGKVDSAENADTVGGHTVAKDVPADAKFTDTVYDDTEIRGEIADKVDKVDGKGLSTNDYTDADKAKLAGVEAGAEVNTIESITLNGTEVTPDANKNVALTVITKAVNDLVNYYLKSETYSKTEVDDIVTALKNSRFEVVATLPTTDIKTNVIYLVPKSPSQTSNVKDEYINLDGTTAGWEKIGDTEIDLSNYVTTQALNTALADYTTTSDLTTLLAAKQDTLTFDNVPTENSNNPVKSGGVYAVNQTLTNQVKDMNNVYGAKNVLDLTTRLKKGFPTSSAIVSFSNEGIVLNGTVSSSGNIRICPAEDDNSFVLPQGTYVLSHKDGSSPSGTGITLRKNGTALTNNNRLANPYEFEANGTDYFTVLIHEDATTFNNAVVCPMICLKSFYELDTSFEPYAKTNQELTAENEALTNQANDMVNVLGAKNLLPFNLADIIANNTAGTWNGKTFTQTGSTLKFTLNDDGSITVDGTANSSATATLFLYGKSSLAEENDFKGMILGGCPSGGTTNGYSLVAQGFDTSATSSGTNYNDLGSGVTIGDKDYLRVYVRVQAGVTVDNLTFYPMVRLASIQDDTYEPYAKTNQQLTQDTTGLFDNLEVNGAVNLLNNVASSTTTTDVTWVVNDDGTVTATVAEGVTTAAERIITIMSATDLETLLTKYDTLKIVGCPLGGSDTTGGYGIRCKQGSKYPRDNGYGLILKHSNGTITGPLVCQLKSGVVGSKTLTFKPMITLPTVSNSDYNHYVPYAKSNRELTKVVTNQLGDATLTGTYLSDCNDVASSGTLNIYNASTSTANSPYTTGVETSSNSFVILSRVDTNNNWGMQLAIPMTSTKGIYMRFKASGTWGTWSKITP